jgi:hypothetical protein
VSFAGISITKELAVVAVVADAEAVGLLSNGQPVAVELYTYADGRAFRGVPYWSYWKGAGQFLTHENNIDELDFGRAISDFRTRYDCAAIGYNREQLLLVDPCSVAVPKDSPQIDVAIRRLNEHASGAERPGYLFEPNTVMQYMWMSLPEVSGVRIFPTAEKVASGRYDGIRAIVNAMVCAHHFAERAKGRLL